jgi:hypothetical protein
MKLKRPRKKRKKSRRKQRDRSYKEQALVPYYVEEPELEPVRDLVPDYYYSEEQEEQEELEGAEHPYGPSARSVGLVPTLALPGLVRGKKRRFAGTDLAVTSSKT